MASSGYFTEATLKSVYDHADIDDTRFSNVNVRIGNLINFVLSGTATDVTNTDVTPVLENFSDELILDLLAAAKMTGVVVPWDFVAANVTDFFIDKYKRNFLLFDMIRKKLNYTETIEVINLSGFGASNDL